MVWALCLSGGLWACLVGSGGLVCSLGLPMGSGGLAYALGLSGLCGLVCWALAGLTM